jgi:hypothetical protein
VLVHVRTGYVMLGLLVQVLSGYDRFCQFRSVYVGLGLFKS